MSSVLIVGGDQVDGIKEVLGNYGVSNIHHWSGRNGDDGNKVIPQSIKVIVLVTKWVNHSITYKVKKHATKHGCIHRTVSRERCLTSSRKMN